MMCNCTSENPYSRSWLWIPGLRQAAHPGMKISPVPSLDRRHRELCQFNAVDTAHIQRHHVAAVGLGAAREDVDAAIHAELVADGVLVEEGFAQIVLAGAKLKALRRQKSEMQALLGADRAVAGRHHGHVGGAFEPDLAAMAAA